MISRSLLYSTSRGGRVQITTKGLFLHALTTFDDGTVRHGLAMRIATRLVMAFGPENHVEIGAYKFEKKDERLTGLWVPPGADQPDLKACGRERSVRTAPGRYTIDEAFAIDGSTYRGKLLIDPGDDIKAATLQSPRRVNMTWQLDDGQFSSFALACGDALYAVWNTKPEHPEPHGIAVFETSSQHLRGTLTFVNNPDLIHEEWHPISE